MKDFQVILRNEFIIDQKGSKESKINNNIKIQELIKEVARRGDVAYTQAQ